MRNGSSRNLRSNSLRRINRRKMRQFPHDALGVSAVSRALSAIDRDVVPSGGVHDPSGGVHDTVHPSPVRVVSGPEIQSRVLLSTKSNQCHELRLRLYAKIQEDYPGTTITFITHRAFPVVLADGAVAQDLRSPEPVNVTITGGIAGPIQLSRIVFTALEGNNDLFVLGHPTMVAKLGNDIEAILVILPATSV